MIEKPKIIFIDIDNTLIPYKSIFSFRKELISRDNIKALKNAQKNGVYVVLSTGKSYEDTIKFHKEIYENEYGRFFIFSNGSGAYDSLEKRVLFENYLDVETIKKISDLARRERWAIKLLDGNNFFTDSWFKFILVKWFFRITISPYSAIKDLNFDKVKKIGIFAGLKKTNEKAANLIVSKFGKNVETVLTGGGYYIEATKKGISKASAALKISSNLDISSSDCVAIGDSLNDYELFKFVGNSIAMGNAMKKLKEIANYKTKKSKNDGVSKAFNQFIKY